MKFHKLCLCVIVITSSLNNISCKKITHNDAIQVKVINSITGLLEKNQAVIFIELNNNPFLYNGITETYHIKKYTDQFGEVNFTDLNIKNRKKFTYTISLHTDDFNRDNFFGKVRELSISKNDNKIYLLEIEPNIGVISIKPKRNFSFQNSHFRVSAECQFVSAGLSSAYFPPGPDTLSELITNPNQQYIKLNYPMGGYKIKIIRYQNNTTDTIIQEIYLNRSEDYFYEFAF
jgi:hypothetical protein